ncbi:MAG: hypothetical protein PHX56_09040 [Atribacterota bacterium]|nr:hypothetical protein [Atribacterota bacterium]MDD4363657.1 hypothetical protein [Atribacterota bacterium]
MEIKIYKSSIVILASSHNPSILSPEWINKNNVYDKKPDRFVNTNDFSFLDFKELSIVLDMNRLTISSKKHSEKTLELLSRIAGKYLELLPHNPYKALGLNFGWQIISPSNKINLTINNHDKDNISNFLNENKIIFGGIIYVNMENCKLRINIEPNDNILLYNFNYHHNIENLYNDKTISFIKNYKTLLKQSESFLKKLYQEG